MNKLITKISEFCFQKPSIAILILMGLCFFGFFNTGLMLDDVDLFVSAQGFKSLDSVWSLFFQSFNHFYRPVGYGFLKICFDFFGESSTPYHVINFIMYFVICRLGYSVVYEISKNKNLALITSVLFTVHPINNMLFNYKTSSVLSCYLIFMLGSFYCMLRFFSTGDNKKYLCALFLYILGLLSHLSTVLLSAYLLIYILFFCKDKLKKLWIGLLPFIGIGLLVVIVRKVVLGNYRMLTSLFHQSIEWDVYFNTIFQLIGWYFEKLLLPYDFVFLWDVTLSNDGFYINMLVALVVLIIICAIFYRCQKNREILFGLVVFLFGISPIFLISFIYSKATQSALIEPHWFTFSSIGYFLILGKLFLYANMKLPNKWGLLIFILIIGILISLNRLNNSYWKDGITYGNYWVSLNPFNPAPQRILAEEYIRIHNKGINSSDYDNCEEIMQLGHSFYVIEILPVAEKYFELAKGKDENCRLDAMYILSQMYLLKGDTEKTKESIVQLEKNLGIENEGVMSLKVRLEQYLQRKQNSLHSLD